MFLYTNIDKMNDWNVLFNQLKTEDSILMHVSSSSLNRVSSVFSLVFLST